MRHLTRRRTPSAARLGQTALVSGADPEAHAAPESRRRWWPERNSVPGQVITTVLAGAIVQALLWFRGDSAAHLVAGAALTTFIGVTVPKGWLRRLDAWAEFVILGVVLGVSWVSEETIVGPFDPIDITFTVAGAFLALAYLPDWIEAGRSERRRLRAAAVGLAVLSLTLRYLVGLGKA